MKNNHQDDFELPEDVAPDPVLEVQPAVHIQVEDLRLGAAEVRKIDYRAIVKKYCPQPPGPGIRVLDGVVVVLAVTSVWLMVKVWAWAIFT